MGDFEIDAVLYFMLSKGGRVRNHELVTHFKNFLNHPNNKAQNRDKFKDFVNELATIKLDGGEKVLVLKKKYRPVSDGGGGLAAPSHFPSSSSSSGQSAVGGGGVAARYGGVAPRTTEERDSGSSDSYNDSPRAQSEPPGVENRPPPPAASNLNRQTSREDRSRSRSSQDVVGEGAGRRGEDNRYNSTHPQQHYGEDAISTGSSSLSLASTASQESSTSATSGFSSLDGGDSHSGSSTASVVDVQMRRPLSKADDNVSLNSNISHKSSAPSASSGTGSSIEDDANISVMDKVKKLNRIQSETDCQHPRNSVSNQGNQGHHPVRKNSKYQGDDDDAHITLGPEEKEWMVTCSATEYHEINRLLSKNPTLAKLKDFTNTALHWAAKSGKAEIIKLIANKPGVNIDQRSGYTALHLAAIHGHEHVIELLVQTYKADANIRDYSGKKAKQYLKNSASSKAQQLLQSRRLGSSDIHSLDDSFVRSSMRMSSRAKEMSSLLQVKNAVARQPMMRTSWGGGSMEELYEEEGDGGSHRLHHVSPASGRRKKSHYRDGELMPPPSNPALSRWSRYSDRSKSSSRESLNSPRNGRRNEATHIKIIPRSESDPSMLEGTIV